MALIFYNYSEGRTQLISNETATARALMAAVDSELASTQAALSGLATSPTLLSGDLSAFYSRAQSLAKSQEFINIVLLHPGVQQVQALNTLLPFGSEVPLANVPGLDQAINSGHPFASDIFVGPIKHKYLVAVGVPVRLSDGTTYALAAGISPDRLLDLINRQRVLSRIIVIVDGSGNIVARTNLNDKFVGTKAAPALLAMMAKVNEGSVETRSVEGIPVLGVFSKSAASNWTISIGIPIESLTTPLIHTLLWFFGGMLLLLLGSLMLAIIVGRRIALPVESLIAPALAIGKGELNPTSPLNLQEAEAVRLAMVEAEKTLIRAKHDALHDGLTGLPNRTSFNLVVHQQLALCRRENAQLSILYVDLDGFKAINDGYGHAVGDDLLRSVSARLKQSTRASDMAARLGGDEFSIALVHSNLANAKAVADKLIETLSAPYQLGGIQACISASIGVAGFPESATDEDTLLKRADQAMYKAKELGKGRACVATSPLRQVEG